MVISMESKTPGNGSTSPFGDGNGATQATGPSTGAHDFVTDITTKDTMGGGRDFTKESRSQQMGPPGYDPSSVPAGGTTPFREPSVRVDVSTMGGVEMHKPFKLNGEGAAPMAAPAAAPDMSAASASGMSGASGSSGQSGSSY